MVDALSPFAIVCELGGQDCFDIFRVRSEDESQACQARVHCLAGCTGFQMREQPSPECQIRVVSGCGYRSVDYIQPCLGQRHETKRTRLGKRLDHVPNGAFAGI